MALFDIFIIILVVLAGIKGFSRGFVIELFSLLAFFIGLILAMKLTFPIALKFFGDVEAFWIIALVIFVLLFLLVVWLAKLIATSIKKVIDFTPVGILDNILGIGISIIKWVFIISTTILVMNSLDLYLPKYWVRGSHLYDVVERVSPIIVDFISDLIPWFKDLAESLKLDKSPV